MMNAHYAGLDVHKETISIAYALEGSREDATYHGQCSGSITSVTNALQKRAEKLKGLFHPQFWRKRWKNRSLAPENPPPFNYG